LTAKSGLGTLITTFFSYWDMPRVTIGPFSIDAPAGLITEQVIVGGDGQEVRQLQLVTIRENVAYTP
jgi:hypothetical protein